MDSANIQQIVEKELAEYSYNKPKTDECAGISWSEEKVLSYVPSLKAALVQPYPQRFLLQETQEHFETEVYEEYWVVAKEDEYLQWYDPKTGEYGLGRKAPNGEFVSIGTRGDLVGVFCAM